MRSLLELWSILIEVRILPPSGDSEDEVTGQASGVVGGQTTTSPRFSTFLPGFAHAFASQTPSSTVKRGK